jgi:hypothetical protein
VGIILKPEDAAPPAGETNCSQSANAGASTGHSDRRHGRQPIALPVTLEAIHTGYTAALATATMLDDDTRRAYASRVGVS